MAKTSRGRSATDRRALINRRRKARDKQYTGAAKMVVDCMRSCGKRGNVRDWVVISGASIFDFWGPVSLPAPIDDKVRLVHKRWLHTVVGEEIASVYWNTKIGRRKNRAPEHNGGKKP